VTSWVRRITGDRVYSSAPSTQTRHPSARIDADTFERLGVKSELAEAHGAFLETCEADLESLGASGRALEPFRAKQYTRTIDSFFKSLGKTLSQLEPDEAEAVAQASIAAMRKLVDAIGSNERLMPAIATLSSMLEIRGAHEPGALAKNAPKALEILIEFAREQEGQRGGHTAFHLLRNLIEVLERRTKGLSAAQAQRGASEASEGGRDGFAGPGTVYRPAMWREVAAFIERTMPASGIDQTFGADLNMSVLQALAGGSTWQDALQTAEQQAIATWAPKHSAVLEQLGGLPPPLDGALADLIRANKTGDDALYGSAQQFAAQVAAQRHRIGEHNQAIVDDLAVICTQIERSPAAAKILDYFAGILPSLLNCGPDVLMEVRRRSGALELALLDASAALNGFDAATIGEVKNILDALPEPLDAQAALAILDHLRSGAVTIPLAHALADRARHASDYDELVRFAGKFANYFVALSVLGDQAGPVAAALAKGQGAAMPAAELAKIAQLGRSILRVLPGTPLTPLIGSDGDGRPGLADLRANLRHDPQPLLDKLLGPIEAEPAEHRPELLRRAIHVAREAAMIDRDIGTAFPRIEEDWRFGLAQPQELSFVPKGGKLHLVRSGSEPTGLEFLRAHDRLPPELAFSAGRHLDQQQLVWLNKNVQSFFNNGRVRVLRDLVFAAIEAQRLDLIDAFVAERVDHKTMMANAEFVAVEFRQGRLQQLPIDRLVQGLNAARDAAAEITGERLGGAPTVGGQTALAKFKTQFDALIAATPPEGTVYAAKGKNWRDPLEQVMNAVAAGNLPAWRAQCDVGKRQLEGLTAKQIEIWIRDDVTGNPDPKQAERPEVQRAFTLLKGLKEALPVEVRLGEFPGFEDMAWDQASLDRLRARHTELVAALHANERGTDEHRALSRQIGPVARRLAILELHQSLVQLAASPKDPVTALLENKALIHEALSSVRQLGGRGTVDAMRQIRDVARTIQSSPRDGRHAVDESTLEGMFGAFTGGCLLVPGGSNQVSLIEHIASVMYKIGRTINAGTTEVRGFARLYRFTFPGWEHKHAIEMDVLKGPGGAVVNDAGAKKMLHEHMLAKAEAMGLPYLTEDPVAIELAKAKGLTVLESQSVTFHVDHGHTGLHHAQNIENQTYWILWQHAHKYGNLVAEPDANTEAARTYTKHVILPRASRPQ
jgi:hypothetical protein